MKIENRILIPVSLEELLNFTKYEELEARIKANLQEVLKFEVDLLKKILVSSIVLYIQNSRSIPVAMKVTRKKDEPKFE